MDLYNFLVEHFIVHDTRALHNDTLTLSHSAYVDGDVVAYRVLHMGDFDNGEYTPGDFASDGGGLSSVAINDPTANVAFIFQLVNAGNVPSGTLSGRLAATADQLAGITAGLAGAGATGIGATLSSPVFAAGLLLEAFANLYSWLDADCDGPVAADQISGPRYWLDLQTDKPGETITFTQNYPGTDSPTGCGGNSNYDVIWSLRHWRDWVKVNDPVGGAFFSATGLSAAAHNGLVHVFGLAPDGPTGAKTLTGATWSVDNLGPVDFALAELPLSAISFDDRLHLFGVHTDGSISTLGYTVDGGSWVHRTATPPPLATAQPIATEPFRDRLYLLARDQTTNALRVTSSADVEIWAPWADVPPVGLAPQSPVEAAALGDTLHLFGIYETGKKPAAVVVHNSTTTGQTWTGWLEVEAGARPEDRPDTEPLDVAATIFDDRIYLAARWQATDGSGHTSMAVNFSGDGDNWSGWRIPQAHLDYQPGANAGVAAVHHHLYVSAPERGLTGQATQVWAY